jgi:hypothetical protein
MSEFVQKQISHPPRLTALNNAIVYPCIKNPEEFGRYFGGVAAEKLDFHVDLLLSRN